MQVDYKETVKGAYRTTNGEGGSQAPLTSHCLALPSAHREEAGERVLSLAENDRDATGKRLDQLGELLLKCVLQGHISTNEAPFYCMYSGSLSVAQAPPKCTVAVLQHHSIYLFESC